MHLFPQADVPVVQVSLPFDTDGAKAFALGQALVLLAMDGVLIVGSGSLTHNLDEFRTGQAQAAAYAQEFTTWVRQAVLDGDMTRLGQTLAFAPHADRAHPTMEHFLPLLVAAGAAYTVIALAGRFAEPVRRAVPDVRIHLIHGDSDPVVLPRWSIEADMQIRAQGGHVTLESTRIY